MPPAGDDHLGDPGDPSGTLTALGYGGRWPALLDDLLTTLAIPLADALHGRVVRADRGLATVATTAGPRRVSWPPTGVPPVTGDWVAISAEPPRPGEPHLLLGTAPRATAMTRPSTHGQRASGAPDQVLAANVDLVGVVAPVEDELNVRRLERGIVMAWESGATPVVLLTKVDLAAHRPMAVAAAERTAVGVDIIATSPITGEGITHLRELLAPHRTLAMLGTSGAGKSTLTNALVGAEVLATGAVRGSDGKGRHTTTHRELVPLPTGGAVLDTPGLRTLGLGVVADGMAQAFPDVEELADGCRFTDCRHDGEPGCAVLAAVQDGTLHHDRLEGWRRVRAASESAALRADIAAYRRQARSWGRVHREVGQMARRRDR